MVGKQITVGNGCFPRPHIIKSTWTWQANTIFKPMEFFTEGANPLKKDTYFHLYGFAIRPVWELAKRDPAILAALCLLRDEAQCRFVCAGAMHAMAPADMVIDLMQEPNSAFSQKVTMDICVPSLDPYTRNKMPEPLPLQIESTMTWSLILECPDADIATPATIRLRAYAIGRAIGPVRE